MGKRGSRPEAQFVYWDLRRHGMNQSEIARKFDITRQAVNKSIKLAERDILYKLLENAQSSGILVEWQDPKKGVLIGITPQLGNLGCIMVVDSESRIMTFFDQDNNRDEKTRAKVTSDLDRVLKGAMGLRVDPKLKFKEIIKLIVKGSET